MSITKEEKKQREIAAAKTNKKQDQTSRGGLINAIRFCLTHKQIRWMFLGGGFIQFGMLVTQYYETIMTYGFSDQFVKAGMPMEAAQTEAIAFVTQALMLFAIGSAIFQLFPGFLADHFGRKFTCVSMCASTVVTFLLFYIGSKMAWNPYFVGLCCGASVGSYWAAGDMVGLVCSESTPTNLRASVMAIQPIFNGIIYSLAGTGVMILGNVLGDAAIGKVVLLVSVPGMALG